MGLSYADRILKVNHAGEHGAVNIYRGQRLVCFWRDAQLKRELEEFRAHEERHRALFAAELERRGVRRCRSYWLWERAAPAGRDDRHLRTRSIAAVTVAVERVVLRHLETQLRELDGADPAAHAAVMSILEDERAHHDHAAQEPRQGIFWPRVLRPTVSAVTEFVIWSGMKL
jgi:ubiquinone biosynthesis monooxygenase Coq7